MNKLLIILLVFGLVLSGCVEEVKEVSISPEDAGDMVPPSDSYDIEDVTAVGNIGVTAAVTGALLSQPQTALFATKGGAGTGTFLSCLQASGATTIAWYSSKTDIASQGIYAVGEEDEKKIFDCMIAAVSSAWAASLYVPPEDKYGFCGSRLTVETENNKKFHIVFIGTSEKACEEMCNEEINGCTSSDLGEYYLE